MDPLVGSAARVARDENASDVGLALVALRRLAAPVLAAALAPLVPSKLRDTGGADGAEKQRVVLVGAVSGLSTGSDQGGVDTDLPVGLVGAAFNIWIYVSLSSNLRKSERT